MGQAVSFDECIVNPLQAVLGQCLQQICYLTVGDDPGTFSAMRPNENGVLRVSLIFETDTVDISPDWQLPLRNDRTRHHISASLSQPHEVNTELAETTLFHLEDGSYADPWNQVIGHKLTSVEVYGILKSPQAIAFEFSGKVIIVPIGYGGSPIIVGDGDELLIFTKQELTQLPGNTLESWTTLWGDRVVRDVSSP